MYDQYVGEIRTFAGDYAPKGWAFCDGQLLWPDDYQALYAVIGSLYGRDGAYFRLPDLRGRLAVDMGVGYPLAARGGTETVTLLSEQLPPHTHQVYASSAEGTTPDPTDAVWAASPLNQYASSNIDAYLSPTAVAATGGNEPHENMMPSFAVSFIIATEGVVPARDDSSSARPQISTFMAEIRLFAFPYPPAGWAACEGQLLSINQYLTLYGLLETTYGGDGKKNFALPDLRGRVPVNPDSTTIKRGEPGGDATHQLTLAEIPRHTHIVAASRQVADRRASSENTVWGNAHVNNYALDHDTSTLADAALTATGAGEAHSNLQPYLVLSYCIAVNGEVPPHP